ncbi:hypothetical protein SAY87_021423 [Trapa incisa]|uniref:Protein kinase domain-containing protein n=1 Tax=Trapa incisa TaxID=236973 RepID=A0AAN7JR12_9MYRT|nr:hypothetical protein SAY87_021423 [Trapa incisa]
MAPKLYPLIAISLLFLLPFSTPDLASDRAALLALRAAVGGRTLLWNVNQQSPCFWSGVECDSSSMVTALHLPADGLTGDLPTGILGNLTQLRTLSLRFNTLTGQVPSDLALCTNLRNVYLQGNKFSGQIPESLFSLSYLVRLNLASNIFSGEVPLAFNNLTRLRTLYLENNQLTGSIPTDLNIPKLQQFNISNNQLNGTIPKSLQAFTTASFLGTSLCGKPLQFCTEAINLPPSVPPPDNGGQSNGNNGTNIDNGTKKKLSGVAIAGIVIGSVIGFILIALLLSLLWRRIHHKRGSKSVDTYKHPNTELLAVEKSLAEAEICGYSNGYSVTTIAATTMAGGGKGGAAEASTKKLVFFGNSSKVFDLEDLLRASAEVLGRGTFGTAYKAALEMGTVVTVKRLRDVNVSAKEFKEKMEAVGAMDHENLVPVRAYYYSNDEKLLIHDYMPMGSLSALLHGNKGAGRTPLNWHTRSTIALGAARGLEYLHSHGPTVTHGNIKSSNILLAQSYEAKLSDFGLAHLVGPSSMPNRVAGYRAPEVTEPKRVSHKADVYSFGVLLLELLTGKAPTQSLLNEEGFDLPRWIQSIVREEWSSEVFDLELQRDLTMEEDMVKLLQLAIDCTSQYPDSRPSMTEVRAQIEELVRSAGPKGQVPESPDSSSR